jgi:hypothetical protein
MHSRNGFHGTEGMNRNKFALFGAFLTVLAVVLVVQLAPLLPSSGVQPGVAAAAVESHATSQPIWGEQIRGIWLQVHNNDPGCPFEDYVREIVATGANMVCLSISAEQENGSSTEIYVDQTRVPSRQRVVGLIRLAKSLDKAVAFMPIVLLTRPVDDEWRGKINPKDWNAWWVSYTKYIVDYAGLCQENDVNLFMVGSELISTERSEQEWRELIRQVRQKCQEVLDRQFRDHLKQTFPAYTAADFREKLGIGDVNSFVYSAPRDAPPPEALVAAYRRFADAHRMRLSYSANWDHYTVPKFWDALDAVGMTTYHDLNLLKEDNPSLQSLIDAWKPIKAEIAEWQQKIGRPIIFTEVGWASQSGCSSEPWNYYHSETLNLVEQQRCMESFLQTFGHEPWVGGVLIWKWRDHPGMTGDLSENDDGRLGYTPLGKPVLQNIKDFLASPNGLPMPTTQPSAAAQPAAGTQPAAGAMSAAGGMSAPVIQAD